MQPSPCAAAAEPVLWSPGPPLLSPSAATAEAHTPRACAAVREATAVRGLYTARRVVPSPLCSEKARAKQQRPSAAKSEINLNIFLKTLKFSSVVSDSLQPHKLQHARLPCLSPIPGAYSNSKDSKTCSKPIHYSLARCLSSPLSQVHTPSSLPSTGPATSHTCSCFCAQSCRFCESVNCSSPGSSVHGVLQARILEWVAISFSRGLPDPGIESASPT